MTPIYMAHMEKRVQEVIDSQFMGFLSAFECTQFIRGELYFYIDSLLTLQNVIIQEDLPSILNFVELVFKLTLKWLEIMPLFVASYKEAIVTPNLFNVDLHSAISMCGYELS